jgi:hypothetical protein
MQQLSLPALVGYDSALMARLPESSQRHIARVAEAWLLSCALLASPVAYAAWLIEHQLWLALLLGAFTFVMVLNLVRLSSAGGGAATHASGEEVSDYRPALGASLVIGLLALLFAQPAQLPLWKAELDGPVQAQRALLIAQHEQALDNLGLGNAGEYRMKIARCDFLVLRLQHMWRSPTRALQLTGLYILAVLVPAVWARIVALGALREYARARWQRDRRSIVRDTRATARRVEAELTRFPSYVPSPAAFADPPFDTRVASALLLPHRQATAAAPIGPRWFARWQRWFARRSKRA